MTDQEFWYRYDDYQTAAPLDEYDNPIGESNTELVLRRYAVVKTTPKGVWLTQVFGVSHVPGFMADKHFVLRDANKRFACPTIAEAKTSFIARKNKHIRILQRQIDNAKRALDIVERLSEPGRSKLWSRLAYMDEPWFKSTAEAQQTQGNTQ